MRTIIKAVANAEIPVPAWVFIISRLIILLAAVGCIWLGYTQMQPFTSSNLIIVVMGIAGIWMSIKDVIKAYRLLLV